MTLLEHNILLLRQRRIYLNPKKPIYCRVGGLTSKARVEDNYGLPCITGYIYWEDGSVTYANNCVFCGRLESKLKGENSDA